jgi:hypothetical protein
VFGVLISALNDDKQFSVDKYLALSVGLKWRISTVNAGNNIKFYVSGKEDENVN